MITKRHYHSAGVIRSGPHLVEVLLFGGVRENDSIAETSVLKFGKYEVLHKGNEISCIQLKFKLC